MLITVLLSTRAGGFDLPEPHEVLALRFVSALKQKLFGLGANKKESLYFIVKSAVAKKRW